MPGKSVLALKFAWWAKGAFDAVVFQYCGQRPEQESRGRACRTDRSGCKRAPAGTADRYYVVGWLAFEAQHPKVDRREGEAAMAKKRVFISHISSEAQLSQHLKQRIERDFLGLVDIFVSSDQKSIQAGSKWLEEVDKALRSADLQVEVLEKSFPKRDHS